MDICVDEVTHGTLTYDDTQNNITCTNTNTRTALVTGVEKDEPVINSYPNPVKDNVTMQLHVEEDVDLQLSIHDLYGRNVHQLPDRKISGGNTKVEINLNMLESGIYFIHAFVNGDHHQFKILKSK